ncbi:ATP-NAD kinase-like domain-containing protein [Choanephora cucurbitarum]|nr:ATP-NAD kinase-like domain-containing protein [Choanephora cucurbitarum]
MPLTVDTETLRPEKAVQDLRASRPDCLSNTAEAVREVSKKIGKAKVKWDNPKTVMIITKPGDTSLIDFTRDLVLWFMRSSKAFEGVKVYIDEKLKNAKKFKYKKVLKVYPETHERLHFWTPELCATQPKMFDFVVTLGGDGTVLFASWLFQTYAPPVISLQLGSLGFLTHFDFEKFDLYLTQIMESGMRVNLRGRLTCTVYRRIENEADCESKSVKLRNVLRDPVTGKLKVGDWCSESKKKKFGEVDGEDFDHQDELAETRQMPCFTTVPVEKYQVINDLVVDRGPSPYMSLLELFGDNKHLTTVQADGLAISTPTGSTAYSLSAGGSLTHPDIHATLITPICPHTLSFRPTLVPDSMELRICVPYNSRNTAWVSFDGRGRVELKQGDHVKVTASKYSFPTVCKDDQTTDWFNSLCKCLHWNKRQRQKSFAIVESNYGVAKSNSSTPKSSYSNLSMTLNNDTHRKTSTANSSRSSSPPLQKRSPNHHHEGPFSDRIPDEVFAMFIEDHMQEEMDDLDDDYTSTDNGAMFDISSDEDDASTVEDFTGWTDQEILSARIQTTSH